MEPFQFEHMYVLTHRGGRTPTADANMTVNGLGGCRSLDDHADKMVEYVKSWGVDLGSRKDKIYEVINDDQIEISPKVTHPNAVHLVTIQAVPGFAKIINAPVHMVWWSLLARTNITGERGDLDQGNILMYGMYR